MSATKEIASISIVGFDARIPPSLAAAAIINDRVREGNLINPACPFVLSADRSVWPSIFEPEESAFASATIDTPSVKVPAANRFFAAFDLWDNAVQMGKAIQELPGASCGIALGLTVPNRYGGCLKMDSWFDAIYEGTGVTPNHPGSDWPILGFDVVNSGLMSALSGFGPLDDIEEVRKDLSSATNNYCLLSDQETSIAYCNTANSRYSADGPFFSMALFLLWDDSGDLSDERQVLKIP